MLREKAFRSGLGRSLKRARVERGLTQRELADVAGIAEKYLSRLELGLATPSVFVASRLANALELEVGDLASAPRAVSSGRRAPPALAAIARLLRARPAQQLDRARRVLTELFR